MTKIKTRVTPKEKVSPGKFEKVYAHAGGTNRAPKEEEEEEVRGQQTVQMLQPFARGTISEFVI